MSGIRSAVQLICCSGVQRMVKRAEHNDSSLLILPTASRPRCGE
jgi:hypothetical protein